MNITIRKYRDRDLEGCKMLWRQLTQHHRDIYSDQSIGGDDPGIYFERYLQKQTSQDYGLLKRVRLLGWQAC